jgi:hypothetical protein
MDINTIKLVRNSVNSKENEADKLQDKKLEKLNDKKGCLKLADYMAF